MPSQDVCRAYVSIDIKQAKSSNREILEAYHNAQQDQLFRCVHEACWKTAEGKVDCRFASVKATAAYKNIPEYFVDVEDQESYLAGCRRLTLPLAIHDAEIVPAMEDMLKEHSGYLSFGADLPFAAVDHWCPSAQPAHQFGDRLAAERMIGLDALRDEGLTGEDVNVIIVDHGLDKSAIEGELKGTYGGGWKVYPVGQPPIEPGTLKVVRGVSQNNHGMMIARNILAVAPKVKLWDLPIVPLRITNLPKYLSDAQLAFDDVLADSRLASGRWVIVNAWAPFDRSTEVPRGSYANNPSHPFNLLMSDFVDRNVDIVFAAGNCGQFRPDSRCGKYDIGPGKSIFGANAHPRVLTVGAITTHSLWLGTASQGQGFEGLATDKKPDLVAPSMFSERADRHTRNGGTSAACAIAAGVVAALRQRWAPANVSPDDLKNILRQTAKGPGKPQWDDRLGYGVINAAAAIAALSAG